MNVVVDSQPNMSQVNPKAKEEEVHQNWPGFPV
jgi:hypothetical protein